MAKHGKNKTKQNKTKIRTFDTMTTTYTVIERYTLYMSVAAATNTKGEHCTEVINLKRN